VAQAEKVIAFRGGIFKGQVKGNTPGIDGLLDGIPTQLKGYASRSPVGVTQAAKEAGVKAAKAGESGVEVFILAEKVSAEAVLGGPIRDILLQQPSINAFNVKTKDGWIRFIRSF